MSQEHPELIFVSGPQVGQRVLLSRPGAVIGRGSDADIMVSEEFVSRRQARYAASPHGPIIENLSDRGTWINGKRFKAGKQVVLDTGDLIGIGHATEMLFVAAGDDPEAALEKVRQSVGDPTRTGGAATGKDAFGRKRRPPEEPKPVEGSRRTSGPPPEEEAAKEEEAAAEGKKPSELLPAERAVIEGRTKKKKLLIVLGIYLGLVALAGVLLTVYGHADERERPMPSQLSDHDIDEDLAKVAKNVTPNVVKMQERQNHAMDLYQQYGLNSSKLYECAVAFKEALAYSDRPVFADPQIYMTYQNVLEHLTRVVKGKYRDACIREKNRDWSQAERQFKELLLMIGDQNNPVFKNVQEHYSRMKYFREKKEPKRRGPAF